MLPMGGESERRCVFIITCANAVENIISIERERRTAFTGCEGGLSVIISFFSPEIHGHENRVFCSSVLSPPVYSVRTQCHACGARAGSCAPGHERLCRCTLYPRSDIKPEGCVVVVAAVVVVVYPSTPYDEASKTLHGGRAERGGGGPPRNDRAASRRRHRPSCDATLRVRASYAMTPFSLYFNAGAW